MENYTKYALKAADELNALLEGKDNLFVIACNKCFKEFDTNQEPELEVFLKLAAEAMCAYFDGSVTEQDQTQPIVWITAENAGQYQGY